MIKRKGSEMSENEDPQIKLLIVEDGRNSRQVYAEILQEEGFYVDTCGSLEEAYEMISDEIYDILLVDIQLPDGSGLDILNKVKMTDAGSKVIIVTGHASVDNAVKALNMGAFAYLRKPLNIGELKISIKRAYKLKRLAEENLYLLDRFKEMSIKDPHTGLYNYRYLGERLKKELERARRHQTPLSIAMIDIDYFKSVNDLYGHNFGNAVLKDFSKFLVGFVRTTDTVIRYSGEEFVIMMPDTTRDGAIMMMRRMLDAISRYVFDPSSKRVRLNVSGGIWTLKKDDFSSTASSVMHAVDRAVRKAKELGGNRLEIHAERSSSFFSEEDMQQDRSVKDFQKKISQMQKRANRSVIESIYALAKTIDAKHNSISEHAEDMVAIVENMGNELALPNNMVEKMKHATLLHDLGKIGVPDKILGKEGPLTPEEYEIVRKHPQIGAEIVRSIHTLEGVSQIILNHHERYNGLGYPAGLKGEEIPMPARIIAIVDVYQALTSARSYNRIYSKQEALEIIKESSGSEFDPDIVRVFLEIMGRDL